MNKLKQSKQSKQNSYKESQLKNDLAKLNLEPEVEHCILQLEKLVAFNTVSHEEAEFDKDNTALIQYIQEELSKYGYACCTISLNEHKHNLLAYPLELHDYIVGNKEYNSGDLGLLLCGHSDTVPFNQEQWQYHPLELSLNEDKNKLHGRGAVDMKGFLACMLTLAKMLAKQQETKAFPSQETQKLSTHNNSSSLSLTYHKPKVSFLITCDEETSMAGAISCGNLAKLTKNAQTQESYTYSHHAITTKPALKPHAFSLVMIGEPTKMQAVIAHKGWIPYKLEVTGKACHSSLQVGSNALEGIHAFMSKCLTLRSKFAQDFYDERFSDTIPYPSLNFASIHGGDALNCVCDFATLGFDIRPTPKCSLSFIEEQFKDLIKEVKQERNDSLAHFNLYHPFTATPAFENKDPQALQILQDCLNISSQDYKYVSYCTEAPFLQELGPCIVCGPGDIKSAHQVDEYIEIAELAKCLITLHKLSKHKAFAS